MLWLEITNDGTGTKEEGNYDYKVGANNLIIEIGRVEGHLRASGWHALLNHIMINPTEISHQHKEE